MGLKKVYWITLRTLVVKLCRYWEKHKAQMPTDLPSGVATALDALNIVCPLLIVYDNENARGQIA